MSLGDLQFIFSTLGYPKTAFRRHIAEAIEIKYSFGVPKHTNINSKVEYNRCVIPDVTETDVRIRENEDEIKLVQRMRD